MAVSDVNGLIEEEKSNFEKTIRDHSFSKYAKVFRKLTIFTPWYAHVRVRIRG